MIDRKDFNLREHNTFGISETCRRFIEFSTVDELHHVVGVLTPADHPLLVIGGGSNLLLTRPFPGTVLHSAIHGIEHVEDGDDILMRCGSGETWDDVVAYAIARGWYGMENLSIIPGDVGASAVQNIGAYGREAKDLIERVEAIDIATAADVVFESAECGYGYRQSKFKNEWRGKYIITHVTYRLSTHFTPYLDYGNIRSELERRGITEPSASDVRSVVTDIRNAKLPDPKVEGNAGSFFMNPVVSRQVYETLQERYPEMPHYFVDDDHEKIPAGWLIDRCGWKGRVMGKAGVHDRQALVLVNKGGAKGMDIVRLCDAIRDDVMETFGIVIHPEVNII
ncbi:MAG: UDP-N-acetylmuramate dehydrogenase [Prevotella sp.]